MTVFFFCYEKDQESPNDTTIFGEDYLELQLHFLEIFFSLQSYD